MSNKQQLNDFPLFSEAVKYSGHEERMIRIAVNNHQIMDFVLESRKYFTTMGTFVGNQDLWLRGCFAQEPGLPVRYICNEYTAVIAVLDSGEAEKRYDAIHHLDEATDQLLFAQDLFALNIDRIARALADAIVEGVVVPIGDGVGGTRGAKDVLTSPTASLSTLSDATTDSPVPAPYNRSLVQSLISILGTEKVQAYTLLTVQLCAQVLVAIAGTAGKGEPLLSEEMAALETTRDRWKTKFKNVLKEDPEVAAEVFDYEAAQAPFIDLTRYLSDPSLLFDGPSAYAPFKSNESLAPAPDDIATRMNGADAVVTMLLMCEACLARLGGRRRRADDVLLGGTDRLGTGEETINLGGKSISACVVQNGDTTPPLNCYFVVDPERFLLVEPDPLRLGKGRVVLSGPLEFVECIPIPDDTYAFDIRLVCPTLIPPGFRLRSWVTIPGAAWNVFKELVIEWEARVVFNGGEARERAWEAIRGGREKRWRKRVEGIREWIEGGG
ncbi:hypothetical protein HK104_011238 [Borealophlyctis nickersoniae]|nr:hypothetical protein HK104_011238 [Borealophlyctis nickersoniae]